MEKPIEYLIIVNPETRKRETSFPLIYPYKTIEELKERASTEYPSYIYIHDTDGKIQAVFTNQNTYWYNGKVETKPSEIHKWNGTEWVIDEEKRLALIKRQQDQVWEQIKQERTRRIVGGVYVGDINKWFHTDANSKQQYSTLQNQKTLPHNMQWKTMDNSFVTVTKELIDLIIYRIIEKEQHDFQNAEIHRFALEKSEEPLNYDYSTGWSEIYTEAKDGE